MSLIELLSSKARELQNKTAFSSLGDDDRESVRLSYAELDQQARSIASLLQARFAPGARALLIYQAGTEFPPSFFGCLYAGLIPVPLPAPDPSRLNRTLPLLRGVLADAQPDVLLTASSLLPLIDLWAEHAPELRTLEIHATDTLPLVDDWNQPQVNPETPAVILYTSGPRYKPRGVVLTHENLLDNMSAFGAQCATNSETIVLNWIPHYTAFGLIFGTLQPLFFGASSCVFSALSFVKRPVRWLQAITNLKATQTAAPNFAYDLCTREITPEQRTGFDLSSLLMTGNGAEMIHASTLENFATAYEPFGFRRETFCPVFGLSEAMVVSSRAMSDAGHVKTIEPAERVDTIDWTLAQGSRAVVSCGTALAGSQVVVINPETLTQCGENEIGEVWASNKSVSCGYWQKPEATARILQAQLPGV